MFPRWTVRMVVFVGGSTHRIDRAYQRAEALFRAPHALGDSVPGRRRPPLRHDNRRAFSGQPHGEAKPCVGRADRGLRERTAAAFLDF
jgi:hypothetical protein